MKKRRQISSTMALLISFKLIISPFEAHAQREKKEDAGEIIAGAALTVIGTAANIYNTVSAQNRPMSPQLLMDMELLKKQQMPMADKFFNPQKMSQIPGLAQYLARNGLNPASLYCTTLPATLTEIDTEVCRAGIKMNLGDPAAQDQEAQFYGQQYSSIEKIYQNFTTKSNTGGEMFGVGCMKKATEILNGFFKSRLDELDKLTTNLEAIQNAFIEASKADLNAIGESTALLDGGSNELVNELKSKNPDLFNFGKRFDNPSCAAMFSKDQFNSLGKGGLNAINSKLQTDVSTKTAPMGFSAESYGRSHAEVVADISSLADKVAKQMELNFKSIIGAPEKYRETVAGLGSSVSSSVKLNTGLTADFFADTQAKFQEQSDKLAADQSEIQSELGGRATGALSLISNTNSKTFEAEVSRIELGMKNDCVRDQSQLSSVLEKIYDPSASGFANENASNFLKGKIAQIMQNPATSLEQKLSELKALESQQGNRYLVKMENSYEVQDVDSQGNIVSRVVPASSARTPGVFFSDVIRSCQAQFKANTLGKSLTAPAALKKLRQLHQDYKSLAKTHADEVRGEIQKKLLHCDSDGKASASVQGSCDSSAFNTGAAGFCAAKAFSCSQKMTECSKQAQKIVDSIKQDRAQRVVNYKAMVEKNKRDVVRLFDTALSSYMRDAELLRGAFGAGFSSPAGIERQVDEGSKHLDLFKSATSGSPDGALLLEDPAKFTEMFKKNVSLLKQSVQEQQEQILGGNLGSSSGLLAKHIQETEQNYTKVAGEASKIAKSCISKHDEFAQALDSQRQRQMEETTKKQTELGEKVQSFCRKYSMAMVNPGPACNGVLDDTYKVVAQMPGTAAQDVNRLEMICAQSGGAEKGVGGGDVKVAARKICSRTNTGELEKLCDALKSLKCSSVSTDGKTTTTDQSCLEDTIAKAQLIVESSGGDTTLSEDSLPAYCVAGNTNTGFKNFMSALSQGVQEGVSSGAQGY